jgi:hypothetical protein
MACVTYGELQKSFRFHTMTLLVGKPEGRRLLEDLGIDGRVILNAS